jgi:hypothetical protein
MGQPTHRVAGSTPLDLKTITRSLAQPVRTDGGRYEVRVAARIRMPLYWEQPTRPVVRATWLVRHSDTLRPLSEDHADTVEGEFQRGLVSGVWPRRVPLSDGSAAVLRSQV